MADPIKVYPAEGVGAHIRSIQELANRVNYPESFRCIWSIPNGVNAPLYQLCTQDNTLTPILINEVTLPSQMFSLDTSTGIITFNEYVESFDFFLGFQVVRQTQGTGEIIWGFCIQQFIEGSGWVNVPNSTRHESFVNQESNVVKTVTFSSASNKATPEGTQIRFVQATNDASKNVGLIADKPIGVLPQSAGFTLSFSVN